MGFEEWKTKRAIAKRIADTAGKTFAEQLAEKAYTDVQLLWNGNKVPFKIHEVNFMEILNCGKFPNLFLSYAKSFVKDKDDKPISQEDAEKVKNEQNAFMHELAKKSMVSPTYQECFNAIVKSLPAYEEGDTVIPNDFLAELYLYYMKAFSEMLKKNLKGLTSNESAERQNTGKKALPII